MKPVNNLRKNCSILPKLKDFHYPPQLCTNHKNNKNLNKKLIFM